MAKKKVTLYTGNDGFSIAARNYLIKNRIDFEEIDATKPEGLDKLVKNTKQTKMPFLEVKGSHGISTSIGFDEFLYASALDQTLSYDKFIAAKGNS